MDSARQSPFRRKSGRVSSQWENYSRGCEARSSPTTDLETAAARIGVDAQVRGENVDFSAGRFVFLEQGIAEELLRPGLLERVCEHCRVEIGESAHLFLKSDVAAARTRVELAEWLRRLLDRMRRGIQENRYKTFTHALAESTIAEGLEENVDLRCLLDLVRLDPKKDGPLV